MKECFNVHLSQNCTLLDMPVLLKLGVKPLIVLSFMERRLEEKEYVPFNIKCLHKVLPFSERTIQECIYKLRDADLIDVQCNNGYMNSYRKGSLLLNLETRRILKG